MHVRWILASLMLSTFVYGQGVPAAQPVAPPAITTTSNLVVVPTLVRSPTGELVQDLQSQDFSLSDDGVDQHVSLDEHDRQPLSIVVLMQIGGAAGREFPFYANVPTMLDAMSGSSAHHAALVTFDSRPEELWSFTSKTDSLQEGFTHPEQGDSGAAIYDAVNFGVDLLSRQPPDARRVLLLLSQFQDVGSKSRVEDVVRRLGENNITIYSVAFSPEKTWLKDQFTKPRSGNPPYRMSDDRPAIIYTFNLDTPLRMAIRSMRNNAAEEIASLSGGEYVQFNQKHDLESSLGDLANHIPNRYMLSFQPSSGAPGLHSLHVSIPRQPSLNVSARSSYWSTPSPTR